MHSQPSTIEFQAPRPGCYVPSITFFEPESEKLCMEQQAKFYRYLADAGIQGLVILGTNAETFLLTREERRSLLRCARASTGPDFPIIAGVSGHSTVQVLEFISDAYEEGADFALVLPCAYFGKQTTPAVVMRFYKEVAASSPLPIIVYNFPAVCNGLDLDSEMIAEIAKQNKKIVGVKLTCGSVAKVTRLAATFSPHRFAVFGGQADFLVGGLASGSVGCIAAFGNIFPRTVVRIFDLWSAGRHEEALALQRKAALAESPTKAGIANTKYAAAVFSARKAGIEDAKTLLRPRSPYEEPSAAVKKYIESTMAGLVEEEDRARQRISTVARL